MLQNRYTDFLNKSINFRPLQLEECTSKLLEGFNRYEKIDRCWCNKNNNWVLKNSPLTITWDEKDKEQIISSLCNCLENGGYIIGAFIANKLIGFASLDTNVFDSSNQYVNLQLIHVSYKHRNKNIGKKLFYSICNKANLIGATKLYIHANSSERTQAFYKSIGCTYAKETNKTLPVDKTYNIQMKYEL